MASKWSPVAREIYRVDLSGAVLDRGWNATHRVSVVIEVHAATASMTVIFGSWDHYKPKCHCIDPSDPKDRDAAAPFGAWMEKQTHFSACNVAVTPIDRILESFNAKVSYEEWDALDAVATYAELFNLKRYAK